MINILHTADWHILLHKKKVPIEWQINRFRLFFDKILNLENKCDIHILAGDVFDKKPSPDEVCLFLEWAHQVKIPTYVTTGNHDSTKKGESFLESFKVDNVINNPLITIITKNIRLNIMNQGFQFFPYGEMQINNLPNYIENDILVSHIRGEVPPHITAEYDFEKIRQWKLVLLGDLHFNHKYKDFLAYYPGSPMNIVFDRNINKEYGINIIEFNNINDYNIEFIDLKLPKLIRKTITIEESMIPSKYNHVVYEVTGNIDQLANIKNNQLLDKRIAYKPTENSKLNLLNKTITEELVLWLEYMKTKNTQDILNEFSNLKTL